MRTSTRNLCIVLGIVVITIIAMIAIAQKQNYSAKVIRFVGQNEKFNEVSYYKVNYVYDGDTIAVNMSGNNEKVRLIGVDTPETHDPDVPVQCYGQQASDFSKANLLNKDVRLEADPTNQNRDRYNRLLRYVYLKDGTLWNQLLIAEGYGFAYLRYPFLKLNNFKETEDKARNAGRGLWSACTPTIINGVYQTNS